ncbi:MAG: SMP-30/gluconolactonase/LRE family protein [Steroidobacteraceae bacterium]
MSTFIDGVQFPEAPVLLPDGAHLFTEMSPATGWILWVSRDGAERRVVARTGRPNGLAPDGSGRFWVAETLNRALLRVDLAGTMEKIAGAGPDHPFLFLNDLAFAPNGDLYLTDSGIDMEAFAPNGELNPQWQSLAYDGRVYRVAANDHAVATIARGLRFANGIAFGPDRHLYVAETLTGSIHRFRWQDGRIQGAPEVYCNVIDPQGPQGLVGPDGMKFAADGSLYVAVFGQACIAVVDTTGTVVRRIRTNGGWPTNLHFGEAGEGRIYVTEAQSGTVQIFDVGVDGCPLYHPKVRN